MPPFCVSVNAYLGAPGIVAALEQGADIVITGRVVDSAVVSAALVHEFGWAWSDYDKLAQAALAGHIIECGAQCTGGNFTDWRDVPDYEHIGFPIVEVEDDGRFVVTKRRVPAAWSRLLPLASRCSTRSATREPICCRMWSAISPRSQLSQVGDNRVQLQGARGLPPTDQYKVSATHPDGFRCTASCLLAGIDAVAKAKRASPGDHQQDRRDVRRARLGPLPGGKRRAAG